MPKKDELAVVNTSVSAAVLEQLVDVKTDGFENVTSEDLGMTMLFILQDLSPQCKRGKPEFDPNAVPGQFLNSLTGEMYESLTVIPIGFNKSYIEWVPREAGGGFVGRYSMGHPRVNEATKVGYQLVLPNGNNLVETAEHFLIVLPENGDPFLAVMPLKSTQLKNSRKFLSQMSTKLIDGPNGKVRAPMFLQKYKLTTQLEENNKGSWYSLNNIEFVGFIDDGEIALAKGAAESLASFAQVDDVYQASAPGETVTVTVESSATDDMR